MQSYPEAPQNRATDAAGSLAVAVLRRRWAVRAPVWLFRVRLGFLLAGRFVMIEHTGRVTGTRRYAVLELIEHPRAGGYVVAAGLGDRAQWLRNVRANHRVRLYRGSCRPAAAAARELGPAEARAVLDRYAARHPRSWAMLAVVLQRTLGQAGDDGTPLPPVITFDVSPGG